MVLIVDVDRELLKELNHKGSVKNLRDRRMDLYRLDYRKLDQDKKIEFAVA